jgi:glucose-6-phosphate isomerase/transaldolase/glucose-6-phosphate isomerase
VENWLVAPSQDALTSLVNSRFASRLWERELAVFSAWQDPAARDSIKSRLGWLDAPTTMVLHMADIEGVAASVHRDEFTDFCLLGMGGSSLCAEVLRLTLAAPDIQPRMHVLDTTDERAVRAITTTLNPARTLFLVASKSGSTIEVTSLEAYFRSWVESARGSRAGEHFIAITDPDTTLAAHASKHGYRHTFINPPDIGGRYSALSLFGLVPAALMNIAPAQLLARGLDMANACRSDAAENPGLALGAFMATHALAGRDKLTLLLPSSLSSFGLWVEQLVAESTGKLGRGILPVVDEPAGSPDSFGSDRAFVLVTEPDDLKAAERIATFAAAGHPVFHIEATPDHLGAEFFRWEFATAVAGAVLDVNPFDEPNVKDAKSRTSAILAGPRPAVASPPLADADGFRLRSNRPAGSPAAGPGTFVAVLDYVPVDDARAGAVARIRELIRTRTGSATTHGLGPRYLHSTGQYHKGGTNNGVFILLTADDATETPVPGADYSFSALKHAQALGDYAALVANSRHVIHCHLGREADSKAIEEVIERLLENGQALA